MTKEEMPETYPLERFDTVGNKVIVPFVRERKAVAIPANITVEELADLQMLEFGPVFDRVLYKRTETHWEKMQEDK